MFLRNKFFNSGKMFFTEDGTQGIFYYNNISLYFFTSDTVAQGPALAASAPGGFSYPVYALLTVGAVQGAQNIRYMFSTGSLVMEPWSILAGTHAAVSCRERGLEYEGGSPPSVTRSYWFQTGTVTPGTNLAIFSFNGFAVGNTDVAIFGRGFGDTGNVTNKTKNTSKYVYNNDTTAVSTDLVNTMQQGAAAGNNQFGIINIGTYYSSGGTPLTNKYTYSNDTTSASLSFTVASFGGMATGPSTFGVFHLSGGNGITSNKYSYSPETVTMGANLLTTSNNGGAGCNGTIGVTV